jgi:Protein of unknown function (DUF2796)
MNRIVSGALALACVIALSPAATAAEEQRAAGTHEHGHGTLTLAIDGKTVSIELEAPGDDIVGFERAPATDAEKAAVAAAERTLANLPSVLDLGAAAGCTSVSGAAKFKAGEGGGEHAEFHVTYILACAAAEKLATIGLPYFKTFPRAVELDVSAVTAKGQAAFEVTPANASIDLASIGNPQ